MTLTPPPRTNAALFKSLVERAFVLGVPRDYGRVRKLRLVREPAALAFIGHDVQKRPQWMAPRAARAWGRLRDAALSEGVTLQIASAFRNVEYQLGIIERKLERGQTIEQILQVSAAPGYSEHHCGRALDVTTPGFAALEEEFERSAGFRWLETHAGSFGFRMSYPRNNPHAIAYEPWHWCWHEKR